MAVAAHVATDYSLTVTGGNTSISPTFTYTPANSFSGGGQELVAFFSSSFTDASGTPNLLINGIEATSDMANIRSFSSGSATSQPVAPEPGTLVFMATGLASLMVCIFARRKRA
jgi:PEP-CTERM motif